MKNASYEMTRRAWKKDNVKMMEVERTSTQRTRHSQKWMKKNEQLDMNEGIRNQEIFTLSEAYMVSCGRICIHTWGNL